jgi:hypothetical protein
MFQLYSEQGLSSSIPIIDKQKNGSYPPFIKWRWVILFLLHTLKDLGHHHKLSLEN